MRFTVFVIPFVLGPCFGIRNGPTPGGMVYQVGSGGYFKEAPLASMEASIIFMEAFMEAAESFRGSDESP